MDIRIILDYIRRRWWLWGLGLVYVLYAGFKPIGAFQTLLFPLFYLAILPISWELQKSGPLWVHRSLPVSEKTLTQTIWLMLAVFPTALLVVSLLPALGFGLVTGRSNMATEYMQPFVTAGLMMTCGFFVVMTMEKVLEKYRPLNYILLGALALIAFKIMQLEWGWDAPELRLGLVFGAVVLLYVSFRLAPQLLHFAERGTVKQFDSGPDNTLDTYSLSLRDRMLAAPAGRSLAYGIFLPATFLGIILFTNLQSGQSNGWNIFAGNSILATSLIASVMMPMILFFGSLHHISSFRCMASLPISKYRQTLIIIGLPVVTATPLALLMITLAITTEAGSALMLYLATLMLYSLMATHLSLALGMRFGFVASIVGLAVMVPVTIMRLMFTDKSFIHALHNLEFLIPIAGILLTSLWIRRILRYQTKVFEGGVVPAGFR